MNTKLKTCGICEKEFPRLWKAKTREHPAMCQSCWASFRTPESDNHDKVKAKAIQKKKRSPIAPISAKKAKQIVEYRRVRDEYFKEHPTCEFPGCYKANITLHHMAGRLGDLLTDKRYFKSLCVKHHQWVEENPEKAKKLGLSTTRLDK